MAAEWTVIDTDILIDVGRNVEPAVEFLERLRSGSRLGVSTVTQMELIVGCRSKTELQQLAQFLRHFRLLPITEAISDTAVSLMTEYRLSHGLLIADALIAATALGWRADLASKNQRDYRFIANLNLLAYP